MLVTTAEIFCFSFLTLCVWCVCVYVCVFCKQHIEGNPIEEIIQADIWRLAVQDIQNVQKKDVRDLSYRNNDAEN